MDVKRTVAASYRWTVDEAVAIQSYLLDQTYWKRTRFLMLVVDAIIVVGASALALVFMSQGARLSELLRCLAVPIAVLIGVNAITHYVGPRYVTKKRLERHFSEQPDRERVIRVIADDSSVTWKTEGLSETTWKWQGFTKVARTPKGFLFYTQTNRASWIPNHAFESQDDIEALIHLARQYAPQYEEAA